MNVMVSTCKHVPSNILVSWSAVSGVIMSVIYCLSEGSSSILSDRIMETSWSQWMTFFGLSLSGLVAFTTLTLSLQLISPNLVASLRCLELVLAFSVQAIISGSMPDVISSIGGTLIILGVIILAFQEKFLHYKDLLVHKIKMLCQPKTSRRADEYERLVSQTVVH